MTMSTPANRNGALWPYGLPTALLAVPVVWLLLLLVLGVTERLAGWPRPEARPTVMYATLVVSLLPLVLRLLDVVKVRWSGGDAGGGDPQSAALAEIQRNRVNYADMAARATAGAPPAAAGVIARFHQLEADARATTDEEQLDVLVEESETLAQRRAFICPEKHITLEAKSHLATLADWGVPARIIESLKETAAPALDVKDVGAARGALHVIFEEYDTWSSYVDDYNANSSFWALTFLCAIMVLATAALFMMFGWSWRILALVCAAIAGATASVIARLQGVTSYGEWRVSLRAYQARIGTGIVGSLVGIGLLGSGLITIALPAPWKTADLLLDACLTLPPPEKSAAGAPATATPAKVPDASTTPGSTQATDASAASGPAQCKGGGMLFVLALTMLLGFSERLLTSLEGKVVGTVAGGPTPGRT